MASRPTRFPVDAAVSAGSSAEAAAGPSLAAQPFLSVRGLSKRLGPTQALKGVDFDLRGDELLVILGPTGAGKTTLLRTLAGLEQPDTGTITMAGEDLTAREPAERDVALVFQNFSLYPRWTVRKNLEFPLRAPGRKLPEAEISRRIDWAADLLKITRYLDRDASRLSGGEMQRVAIGRAIVRRPRLFLMDEPLTNLDAKLRETLRVELVQLRRELATPMIFVTHDQAEALSMADRIAVLSAGRILQSGAPRDIYERPLSPVVARQLGQPGINLLRVRRVAGRWLALDGTPLVDADPAGPDQRLLGIRPEDIAAQPPGASTREGGAAELAVVKIVEYIGPTTTLLVTWAGTELHILVPRKSTFAPGDHLMPRIDPARVVLFDADDGGGEGRDVRAPMPPFAGSAPVPPAPPAQPGQFTRRLVEPPQGDPR